MKKFFICYLGLTACSYLPIDCMDGAAQNQPVQIVKKARKKRLAPEIYRAALIKKIEATHKQQDSIEKTRELVTLQRKLHNAYANHREKQEKIQLIINGLEKQLPHNQQQDLQEQPAQAAGWLASIFSWWGSK